MLSRNCPAVTPTLPRGSQLSCLFCGLKNMPFKGSHGLCVLGWHLQKSVPWMLNRYLKNKKQSPGSDVQTTLGDPICTVSSSFPEL